jgi:hypothetical protein
LPFVTEILQNRQVVRFLKKECSGAIPTKKIGDKKRANGHKHIKGR